MKIELRAKIGCGAARRRLVHRTIAGCVAAAVSANTMSSVAFAQARAITRAEYEACQSRDEVGFRQAIEVVTTAALKRGLQGIDYRAIASEGTGV